MQTVIEKIDSLRASIPALSGGVFALEEYVLLPHYGGNVMLRFGLMRESVTAKELDALERELYSLLPEGFFADFMGSVYRRAGVSYEGLEEKLVRCAESYRDEPIPVSPFFDEVDAEAKRLLRLLGLPEDTPVWEIQPDEEETALLILGDENAKIKEVQADGMKYEVISVRRAPCEGLMRAAVYARERGVSLMQAVCTAVQEESL